jgi:hypothetical protein
MKTDIPPELVAICEKALAPKAEDRYQSAAEMLQAVEGYLQKTNDRASSHEIGNMLQTLFADRREEVSKAVEQRLGALQAGVALNLDALMTEAPNSSRLSHTPSNSASFSRTAPLAAATAAATGPVTAALPSPDIAERTTLQPPGSGNRKLGTLVGIGAGALVLGVVAVVGIRAAGSTGPTTQPSATATNSTNVPTIQTTSTGQEAVALRISLTPAAAKIFIDDVPLDLSRHYARDGAMHRVRAEAPGYEPQSQLIPFADHTVELNFALQPVRTTAPTTTKPGGKVVWPPTTKATATTTAEPPATTVAPPPPPQPSASGKKPVIDTGDPWKTH